MNKTSQLSARDRINSLLDNNSFVEVGGLVTRRNTDFNLTTEEVPGDGVITGYGTIDNRLVYVYSQDTSALNGTVGEMHARKITHLYDLALKVGAPIIGLIDSAGMRLQEATDALDAFGKIYMQQAKASGVIPQVTGVLGNCGGGAAVLTSLSDFTFITEDKGKLFVNSPNTLDENYTSKLDTSSVDFNAQSGAVDFVCKDDLEVLGSIRQLISILPDNNGEYTSFEESTDDLNRLVPNFSKELEDTSLALIDISDNNFFMETKAKYAKDMVTGFIRLNGMTVGALANRTKVLDQEGKVVESFDGFLSNDACLKAEAFVKFCDSFNIPVLTLTNVNGFKATVEEEKTIAKSAAKLTYAFTNASVAKVNLIVGKAYGSAYITMNSKHIGADLVFALDSAKIGMMDGKSAAQIMYGDDEDLVKEKSREYDELQSSAQAAASRGYVDAIIEAPSTRKHLIYAFDMLFTKVDQLPSKKHGTV